MKHLYLIMFLLFVFSCEDKQEKQPLPPGDYIPEIIVEWILFELDIERP